MREITSHEIKNVSGGWDAAFHFGFVDVNVSGEEVVAAYDWAVDKTADFFCWWDPMNYFENHC